MISKWMAGANYGSKEANSFMKDSLNRISYRGLVSIIIKTLLTT
jgi:hypothetical protein